MLTSALSMIPRVARSSSVLSRASMPAVTRAPMARMPVAVPLMARGYASGGGPSLEEIKTRIADVIKSFEKVNPQKVGSGCQTR